MAKLLLSTGTSLLIVSTVGGNMRALRKQPGLNSISFLTGYSRSTLKLDAIRMDPYEELLSNANRIGCNLSKTSSLITATGLLRNIDEVSRKSIARQNTRHWNG